MKPIVFFLVIGISSFLGAQSFELKSDYPSVANFELTIDGASLSQEILGEISSSILVSSVEELAVAAKASNRKVKMVPGTYQMSDYATSAVIAQTPADISGRKGMLTFSGSNNTFDLTGVTIEVNTELLNDYGAYIIEAYVTGNNVVIDGLTLTDIGAEPTTSKGGNSFTVEGDNVKVQNVTLNVSGSFPYGYGDLFGKGSGNLVSLKKHSGMLLSGTNDSIMNCSIISRSFGHCFFIQGGQDIHLEDCYAESVVRATNDMLAETSGTAFNLNFASIYKNYDGKKVITPGYVKSLSECGFRTYNKGGVTGRNTGAVTVLNCKAKNTRIGFAFTRVDDDMSLTGCEAIGCENGFNMDGITVRDSRGDAQHGPLLYVNSSQTSDIELSLMPDTAATIVHAIITVMGNDHVIKLDNWEGEKRKKDNYIRLGYSRPSASNPFSPLSESAAFHVNLTNLTGMPVLISSEAQYCTIKSDGVVTNNGLGNTVDKVE